MAIDSIQALLDSQKELEEFKGASPDVQIGVLESINPLFKNGSPEARRVVMQRILDQPTTIALKDVPALAIKNFPKSVVGLGGAILQAISHPKETVEGLTRIGVGGVQKLIPGEQGEEQTFNTVVDFFKDRYGSYENIKRTIANDPAGFFSDLSIVTSGGGGLVSTAGKVSRLSEIAKAGQTISKTGQFLDLPTAAGKGIALLASKEKNIPLSRSLVKSSVKFADKKRMSEVGKLDAVDKLADEFIQRGLKLDKNTVQKLGVGIKTIQDEINNIVQTGQKQGVTIKITKITDSLDDLVREIEDLPISTPDTIREAKIVANFRDKILSSPKTIGGKLEEKIRKATRITNHRARKEDIISKIDKLIDDTKNKSGTLEYFIPATDINRQIRILKDVRSEIAGLTDLVSNDQISPILKSLKEREAILSPVEVQNLKKLLNKSFTPALETSVDAVRKIAKDRIRNTSKLILEDRFPQLKALNANQGVMIELQEAIAKRIRQIQSARTFGVPGLVVGGIAGSGAGIAAGTSGASLAQTIGAGATFAALAFATEKIINSPAIQIKLAEALNAANQALAKAGNLHLITQPSFQAGRMVEESQSQ